MDGLQINQKIRFGYAKAAQKLGQPFDLYRSATPMTPIQDANLIGTLPMVASQDWTWMKANRPGNSTWFVCVDGQDASAPLEAEEGDYLIGDQTYFIFSKEYQLPMQAVQCNKMITLIRPYQSNAAGYDGNYAGYQEGTSTVIMENMPISLLLYGRGARAESKLPTDTDQPSWIGLMPNLGDINVRTGDVIQGIDDLTFLTAGTITDEDRFVVMGSEETEFGWRLTCHQMMN
jgi:hypothetical protein